MTLDHKYRLKFYMNASHYVTFDNQKGANHSHTWEIVCEIKTLGKDYVVFHELEQKVRTFLDQFEGRVLNDCEIFSNLSPSLENITTVFWEGISNQVSAVAKLERIEVSESPNRCFIIDSK